MKEKKEYILKKSLECFIKNGVIKTSISVLEAELCIPRALIYYYFNSKDDLVTACAEEAAKRLEDELMDIAVRYITRPDSMLENIKRAAQKKAPMMRFLATIAASSYYGEMIKPALKELAVRYNAYSDDIAQKLGCDADEIRPTVYMAILATTNYMIFGEESLFIPQMQTVIKELEKHIKQ